MISVGFPLCCAQVEMALIPSQEINPIIVGRSAVAAQTQYNSLAQLRTWRLRKLKVFVSVLIVFTAILAAGVCHYPAVNITPADLRTTEKETHSRLLLYFQTI